MRLHAKFQLPRHAETSQLYFSGWPAKPENNANLSSAFLTWAWAELGNISVEIIVWYQKQIYAHVNMHVSDNKLKATQ